MSGTTSDRPQYQLMLFEVGTIRPPSLSYGRRTGWDVTVSSLRMRNGGFVMQAAAKALLRRAQRLHAVRLWYEQDGSQALLLLLQGTEAKIRTKRPVRKEWIEDAVTGILKGLLDNSENLHPSLLAQLSIMRIITRAPSTFLVLSNSAWTLRKD